MLSSGQLLAERYQLSSRIAVGGMGEVWEANDTRLDRTVAVKILKAELSGDAEFLHRFRTEARTTASLNHPGIAGVHDYGETVEPGEPANLGEDEAGAEQQVAYLVMELVRGEPLAGILAREGRISTERTLDVLEQAGHALQAAHENGLVHRDVKPGNILVTAGGQVKITDFGVSKAADAAPVTRSGMVMGTAHYIAPEQALGHSAEPASDVYSLAVCGYECLAGYRPFRSENAVTVAMMHIRDMPPPLPPDVSGGVRALIETTLVKDPRQRYRAGGEFAGAVAAVRMGHPLPAPAATYTHLGRPSPTATYTMTRPGPGSHPAMQPVAQPGTPPSGVPLGPPQTTRPRRSAHTALWVVLATLLLLLVLAGALLLPRLFADDSSGTSHEEESGGGRFGVTDTSQPSVESGSPLPSERHSRLHPSGMPEHGQSTTGTEGGSRTSTGNASDRPGMSLGTDRTGTSQRHGGHDSGTVTPQTADGPA